MTEGGRGRVGRHDVQLSPGYYPATDVNLLSYADWTFRRCTECPPGARLEEQVYIQPVPLVGSSGPVFSSFGRVDPNNWDGAKIRFEGVIMEPYPSAGNSTFPGGEEAAPPLQVDSKFRKMLFDIDTTGLEFVNCEVRGFQFSGCASFVDACLSISIINSTFHNNHAIDLVTESFSPLFGRYRELTPYPACFIDHSTFRNNTATGLSVDGAFFRVNGKSIISNSVFVDNRAQITTQGRGMLFSFAALSDPLSGRILAKIHVEVTNCTFERQSFTSTRTVWQALLTGGDSTVTAATGAIFFVQSQIFSAHLDIRSSRFISNSADQVSCIAMLKRSIVYSTDPTGASYFNFQDLYFEDNRAEYGIGALMYLADRPKLKNITFSGMVFRHNLAPTRGYFVLESDRIGAIRFSDASLISISDLSASVIFNNLTFEGFSGSVPLRPSYNYPQSSLYEIHRIQAHACEYVTLNSLTYIGATPGAGVGTYIQLANLQYAVINNTVINTIDRRPSKLPPGALPWTLISVTRTQSDVFLGLLTQIESLSVMGWGALHDTTLLFARMLRHLSLKDWAVSGIESSESTPLMNLESVAVVDLVRSSFFDFANPILISNSESVTIMDISLEVYSSSIAIVRISESRKIYLAEITGRYSTAAFFSMQGVVTTNIRDSTFLNSTLQVPDSGAITWKNPPASEQDTLFYLVRTLMAFHNADKGSALYIDGAHQVTFEDARFVNNSAATVGGAVFVQGAHTVRVLRSDFQRNSALLSGGAIHTLSSTEFFSSSFDHNSATSGMGGAIFARVDEPLATGLAISNCSFTANWALSQGGAVHFKVLKPPLRIQDSNFTLNHVTSGFGGALSTNAPFNITTSQFYHNRARKGGAMYWTPSLESTFHSPISLSNSSFILNEADEDGGAMRLEIDDSQIIALPWNAYLDGNLFEENQAANGGVISSSNVQFDLNNTVKPNIFLHNRAQQGAVFHMNTITNKLVSTGRQLVLGNRATVAGGVIFYEILTSMTKKPDPGAICTKSECANNTAEIWGSLSATQSLDLTAYSPSNLNQTLSRMTFYPGIDQIVVIKATDQFEQELEINPDSLRIQAQLRPLGLPWDGHVALKTIRLVDKYTTLQLTMELTGLPAHLPQAIPAVIVFLPILDTRITNGRDAKIFATIQECGAGYGQDPHDSSQCVACPLSYFSRNGTCSTCAFDSTVASCSGDTIDALPNYWVSVNDRTNQYRSLRCPSGFCLGKNQCVPGRTGPLCGKCQNGKHESIFAVCTDCNSPNWGLIAFAIVVLWIAVLIFHAIVSASSGKSSILIFFLSTSLAITYQIPITDVFSSHRNRQQDVQAVHLPKLLEPFVCLFPMDLLERNLLAAVVPVFMAILITLTFILHRLIWFIYRQIKGGAGGVSASEFSLLPRLSPSPAGQINSGEIEEYGFEASDTDDASEEATGDALKGAVDKSMDADRSSSPSLGSSGDNAMVFEEDDDDDDEGDSADKALLLEHEDAAFLETLEVKYRWQIENRFFHHYRLIRTLLTLFAATFSLVLGIVMSTVGCTRLSDGRQLLQTAPGISCDSKYFRAWRISYAFFIPYLVLVAASLLGKLIYGYLKNQLSQTDVRFGSWYEMFKPHLFAWKVVEMFRRICILCISQLLISDPSTRASLLAVAMIVFLMLQLLAMPYRQKLENSLESLSLATLSVVSLLVFMHSRTRTASISLPVITWVLIILVTLAIISGFASAKLSSFRAFLVRLTRRCT